MSTDYIVTMCDGPTCKKSGSSILRQKLEEQLEKHSITDNVRICLSGCLGICEKGPVLIVNPGYTIYGNVKDEDIPEIVSEHLIKDQPVARLRIQEDHS